MIFQLVLLLLITIINTPYCLMLSDQKVVKLLRKMPTNTNVVNRHDLAALDRQRLNLVIPGTKWCGPGDAANDYDDLGTDIETDKCCRQHDSCSDIIPAGETKYNLTNKSYFTRLHCSCDETFRQCLRTVNSKMSKRIGIMFFNVIGSKCYRKDYPVTGCKKERRMAVGKMSGVQLRYEKRKNISMV